MKICIDVRSPGKTGILTYATCLVNSLLRVAKTNEYILITERAQEHLWHPGVEKIVLPSRNPVSWFVWSNTVLPKLLEFCDHREQPTSPTSESVRRGVLLPM